MSGGDHVERGLFEFEQGNFKAASDFFSKVITNGGPDQVEALKRRSTCHFEMGKYKEAFDDATRIVKMAPESTSGYALCGCALTKLSKFEEAYTIFKRGLDIDTNDDAIKTGLKVLQADIIAIHDKSDAETESTYDAVRMSSQEPYPGDKELETLEKEIMQKWGIAEFPDLQIKLQDQAMATKEYKTALQYRKAGNNEQAIEKLKSALMYDTPNFTFRGDLALLLYDTGEYREAYQHCQCIPADFRISTFWKLGGKILNALDLPVHAEAWLRQGCRLDKKDDEMPLLFQNIRVKRLYGPLTDGSKVNVKFTQYGRAIVASDDIMPGHNLFRDKPAVLAQTLDTLHVSACAHCAKCLMRADEYFGQQVLSKNADLRKMVQKHWPIRPKVECSHCGSKTIYCSKECREDAWSSYHQVLCVSKNPAVEKLHNVCSMFKNLKNDNRCFKGLWNASYSPFVLAKMWASIICLANNLAKQNGRDTPSTADWTLAKSPLRKFIAYGSSSNATVIPEMLTLMQEVFDNEALLPKWRYKITAREFDGRYFQATCNVQAFSDPVNPFNAFMRSVQNDPKRDIVLPHTRNDPEDALFAGMFPLHACLNHSCDNNVEVLDGSQGVLVRAKRPIKAGEELFTTYINTRMHRKERRAWLFRGYNFWCHCTRCKFEGDDAVTCTQCGKKAKDESKEKYPGCGKCQRAWYCSVTCQKTAWKAGHKKICSTPHSNTSSPADTYMENAFK